MKVAHFSIQGSLHSNKLTVQILKQALHRVFQIAVRGGGRGDFPFSTVGGGRIRNFTAGRYFYPVRRA